MDGMKSAGRELNRASISACSLVIIASSLPVDSVTFVSYFFLYAAKSS